MVGPQGFTMTSQQFDLKPGGTWEFIMHGPDGVDFPNTNVFVEVVKPERIVIKHAVFPHFLASVSVEELEGKTHLTYQTVFEETVAVFDKVKTYAVSGVEQTMDRLEEHLAICLDTNGKRWFRARFNQHAKAAIGGFLVK